MGYFYNNDAYCTHQKYTQNELNNLSPNAYVLELGVGNGSSPLMYEFCKNNPESTVISFETDDIWFEKMRENYGDLPNYIFKLIDNWDNFKNYLDDSILKYDLVFVDQSPWEARISSIDLLKNKTNIFILHDYDYYNQDVHGWVETPCNNICINDETSWLGKKYSNEFILEDNYEVLPPTLVMKRK